MPHTKGGSLLSFPPKDPIYGVYNVQLHSKSLLGLPLQVFLPSMTTFIIIDTVMIDTYHNELITSIQAIS